MLHRRSRTSRSARNRAAILTVGETSFRNAKPDSARLVGYKIVADLAGKSVVFVLTIAAARRLPPKVFGVFSLASTLGWMLAVAADFGIQLHVARGVARTPSRAAALLAGWLRVRAWTASGTIALVMLGLVATRTPAGIAAPMLLFAAVYACTGLIEFLHYFYRGLSRSDVESSLILGQRIATLVLGLFALAWWPSVTLLAVAMLLPAAGTLLVSIQLAHRITPVASHQSPIASPESFWRDVFPIGAGIVLSALYFRIDVFLVEWWQGAEAVAMYNAVFRLIEALRLFPAAVLAVALPALCRARGRAPIARLSAGVTLFAAVVSAVLWETADWTIPLLYGRAYAASVPAFRVLALSFPLLSLNYALTHQLVAWNGQRFYATLCGLALVVNVALNVRLIPAASIEGAAWATLATELFLTLGCVWALATRDAADAGVAAEGLPA